MSFSEGAVAANEAALDQAPRLLAETTVAAIADGEVVIATPDSQRALVLNASAAIVVSLCTGDYRVREIAQLFSETLGIEIDRAQRDVLSLLVELRSQGLLVSDD